MSTIVPLDAVSITAYLDRNITHWRNRKDKAISSDGERDKKQEQMAICYIDAYQSVRISLFGELLPLPEFGESMQEVAEEWMGSNKSTTIPTGSETIGDPNRK